MALTLAQKVEVAFALCYPGNIVTQGNVNYNSVFNDRLDHLNEETVAIVVDLLAKIDAIEEKLNTSPSKSNVKRIDDIELDTAMSDRLISKESNRLRNRLSSLVDIPNKCAGGSCMVNVCV